MLRLCARAAALVAATTLLAGCQWLTRRDTISYQAGDAVAWNRAIHTIDPWPPASADTTIPVSGRRVAKAIERYEAGPPASSEAVPTLIPIPSPIPAPPQ